jgi:hypothetical protein
MTTMNASTDTVEVDEPYRGLEPYRFRDRFIFFEREHDAECLMRLVTMYRATLLYGESGAGKSSLINAGLVPKVLDAGMAVERLRVQPQLGREIVVERIARSAAPGDYIPSFLTQEAGTTLDINDFSERVEHVGTPTFLLFDQFEELLTLAEDEAAREQAVAAQTRIVQALAALIQDRKNRHLRFLFVFREDYLAKFELLFYLCPELPDHFLRLTSPAATALASILKGPFESGRIPQNAWRREIPWDAIATLEQQLRPSQDGRSISLSRVQIAALQVWRADNPIAVLAERGADGLIRDYFIDQLNRFGKRMHVAEALLSAMVTGQGTRKVISETELVEATRTEGIVAADARNVLNELVTTSHLVRRDHYRGEPTYEIVSEFLVASIQPLKANREAERQRNRLVKRILVAAAICIALISAVAWWRVRTTTEAAERDRLVKNAKQAQESAQQELAALKLKMAGVTSDNDQLQSRRRELEERVATLERDRDALKTQVQDQQGARSQLDARLTQEERSREASQAIVADRERENKDLREQNTRLSGRVAELSAKPPPPASSPIEPSRAATAPPPTAAEPPVGRVLVKTGDHFIKNYFHEVKDVRELYRNKAKETAHFFVASPGSKKNADGTRSPTKAFVAVIIADAMFDENYVALRKAFEQSSKALFDGKTVLADTKRLLEDELKNSGVTFSYFEVQAPIEPAGGPLPRVTFSFEADQKLFDAYFDHVEGYLQLTLYRTGR